MSLQKEEADQALALIKSLCGKEDIDVATKTALDEASQVLSSPLYGALLDVQEYYELTLNESYKALNGQEIRYWEHDTGSVDLKPDQAPTEASNNEEAEKKYRPSSSDDDQNDPSDPDVNDNSATLQYGEHRQDHGGQESRRSCTHSTRDVTDELMDQNEYEQAPFQTRLSPPLPSSSGIYIPGHYYEYDHITLERGKTGLGFSIAGGRDNPLETNDPSIYITKIIPGGAAEIDQRLRINDAILMVNGIDTSNVCHADAVNALKIAGSTVSLRVRRVLADVLPHFNELSPREEDPNIREHIIDIQLVKGCKGLGFSIAGGVGNQHIIDDNGIYVTKIIPGGAAEEDGNLEVGDRILTVDGKSVIEVTHEQAVNVLQQTNDVVNLRILRHDTIQCPPNQQTYTSSNYVSSSPRKIAPTSTSSDLVVVKSPPITPVMLPPPIPEQRQLTSTVMQPSAVVAAAAAASSGRTCAPSKAVLPVVSPPRIMEEIPPALPPPPSSYQFGSNDYHVDTITSSLLPNPPFPPTTNDPVLDLKSASATSATAVDHFRSSSNFTTNEELLFQGVRTIELQRSSVGLGFNIVGGSEEDGIFISHIMPGGVADVNGKLQKGDQILSVNGVDLSKASHREAVEALKGAGRDVCIVAEYKPEEFRHFQDKFQVPRDQIVNKMTSVNNGSCSLLHAPGNGGLLTSEKRTLYVRALFDYDAQRDSGLPSKGLSFRYGDILHVVNASDDEWWQARRVEGERDSDEYGVVPSKLRVERRERSRLKQVKFSHSQPSVIDKQDSAYTHVKRKKSHTFSRKFPFYKSRENLDESSDLENSQVLSSQSDSEASIKEDTIHSYETVVQKELQYTRPVVLLGPFKDRINDDLLYENPEKFSSCVPHTTRAPREDEVDGREYHFVSSRKQMEEDIKNNYFIEAGQYNDNLYGTSIQSVKDVAEQGKHCILDVSGNAIKRLQVAGLWPIAIFIKPPSIQWLIEMNKRLIDESARKIFDRAEKQEQEFGEYFTAIVRGETIEQLHTNVKNIIKDQSGLQVWLPLEEDDDDDNPVENS